MKLARKFICIFLVFIIFTLFGCDAFVRKFTRKQKKEDLVKEEMVLAPEEYKGPQVSKEEQYRQYFLYWKSWHDELIEALLQKKTHKKQLDCADEAIKNLISLKSLLNENRQKNLDVYLDDFKDLRNSIANDLYSNIAIFNRNHAERIKRDILQKFSFQDIKKDLL